MQQRPSDIEKNHPEGSLVFVWNADAGILNAVKDSLHKWISPETYSCRLCELTHGFAKEKKAWRTFLDCVGKPVFFYYRDTFDQTGISGDFPYAFPLVLERNKSQWKKLLGPDQFVEITTLEGLIRALEQNLRS